MSEDRKVFQESDHDDEVRRQYLARDMGLSEFLKMWDT